jgi:phytoene/squalene synthetase
MGAGNPRWIAVLSIAAALGCFGYLNANMVVGAIRNIQRAVPQASGPIYAMLAGMISMIVVSKIAQKKTWLREYTLGVAMLTGMFAASLLA